MKKCPKCGQWTVALNISRSVLECRRIDCDYKETVNVNEYLEKTNVLPKLAESLKMNGKTATISTH